uniref:F-box domain-containing protein n=1 Tax=Daucus carota subsp. sativus TaxID=79200 RepID=A0A165Z947_DAUCS
MSEDDADLAAAAGGASIRTAVVTTGGDYSSPYPDQVLENVLENVLIFLTSRRDRNAVSLVCKSWYRAEALTRSEIYIGNCYSVSPRRAAERFRRVRSVVLKGKPRFADFSLMPPDWGAHFAPWVIEMAEAYRGLEKLYLKRMNVTDDDLAVMARSFGNFRELVLVCCEGFGTAGLAVVASKCRQLRVFDLIEAEVSDDDEVDWLSCFPESGTCLESLIFDCVEFPINFDALENLVARSRSLKKLRVNRFVNLEQLHRLMILAPQLTDLGTGSFSPQDHPIDQEPDLVSAFTACRSLVSLSGFRETVPDYLPAVYPVCANITSLNFSYANITADELKPVIRNCHKLQIFWVLDSVRDEGLQAVAATCKDLRELRVFPIDATEDNVGPVSDGCREIAQQIPRVIVEVFRWNQILEEGEKSDLVDTLYLYRSLEGEAGYLYMYVVNGRKLSSCNFKIVEMITPEVLVYTGLSYPSKHTAYKV